MALKQLSLNLNDKKLTRYTRSKKEENMAEKRKQMSNRGKDTSREIAREADRNNLSLVDY